jgi:hypothetical protein
MLADSLPVRVLSFLRALRERPQLAFDPEFLSAVERDARQTDGGHVVLAAPVAGNTSDLSAILAGDDVNPTAKVPLSFPWPVEVLGFYVAAVHTPDAVEPPGSFIATPDDVHVAIDFNNELWVTQSGVSAAASSTNSFVTLAAMGVQVPRLTGIRVHNAAPVMGAQFRWAVNPAVKRCQRTRPVICPFYRRLAV